MLPSVRPDRPLDVERRQDLAAEDDVADVRGELGDPVDDRVAERLALVVPGAQLGRELVRRVLDEAADDVLAGRRHRRVDEGRDDHVDVRPAAEVAVLRVVVGLLHLVDRRAEARSRRGGARPSPGRQVKSGRRSTARLTLPDEPRNLKRRTSCLELRVERARLEQVEERDRRVGRDEDDVGLDLLADSRATTPVARPSRTMIRATGASVRISAPSARAARAIAFDDAAGAALRDAPGAEGAVDLAHVVVEQDVGRARASGRPGRCR